MCNQQRLRPAWAYTHTDQSLCKSFEYSMSVKLLTERHLEVLNLKGGCTGSSEPALVKMPQCWKSHVAAHLVIISSRRVKHTDQTAPAICCGFYTLLVEVSCEGLSVQIVEAITYSKTRRKRPLKNRQKKGLNDKWLINEDRKYCRMLSWSILQYF